MTLRSIVFACAPLLLCLPEVASAQEGGGFDLDAALDAKKSETNDSRTILNHALKPFYNAQLVELTVGKPALEVEGDRVVVNYPVQAKINMAKYMAAVKELNEVLGKIGKRVPNFGSMLCSTGAGIGVSNQCQERRSKTRTGKPWIYYELSSKLTSKIPQKHIRFIVNNGHLPRTIQAWDVPVTALDKKTLETHLGTGSNPTKVQVGLTSADNTMVTVNEVEVGIRYIRNRSISGANLTGNFAFINPHPFFRGNFNVIWESDPTVTIPVSFKLSTETARKIKKAVAKARPKAYFKGKTQKVR